MVLIFGGDVRYWDLAITNLPLNAAWFQGKILPAWARRLLREMPMLLCWRWNLLRIRLSHRHVPVALPDLLRGDVFRTSIRRSTQQRNRQRRLVGHQRP